MFEITDNDNLIKNVGKRNADLQMCMAFRFTCEHSEKNGDILQFVLSGKYLGDVFLPNYGYCPVMIVSKGFWVIPVF